MERVLELVITGVVWTAVAALLVAIVAVNGYAALHAWRSGRPGWTIVILALSFTGALSFFCFRTGSRCLLRRDF